MDKFRNRYRIPSTRLRNWDYGWNGSYFVTICVSNHNCVFGEIRNDEMVLSEIGELAKTYWIKIPEHFPNVYLNAFVVMPNHIHGIIIIDKPYFGNKTTLNNVDNVVIVNTPNLGVSTLSNNETTSNNEILGNNDTISNNETTSNCETITSATNKNGIPNHETITIGTIGNRANKNWKPGDIGVIINQFKRICTIDARKIDFGFAWQPLFHDHVIQDDRSFSRIRKYIINNPKNWKKDKFHK